MSVDHDAEAVVGFAISFEDFFKPLMKRTKEEFHMEDRFDSKSGKKLDKQEKVVDKNAGFAIVIGEHEFEGPESKEDLEGSWCPEDDVMEAISERLNAHVWYTGDMYNGCCFFVCIEPYNLVDKKEGPRTIKNIIKQAKEFERIRKDIKELIDMDPGEADVTALMSVC